MADLSSNRKVSINIDAIMSLMNTASDNTVLGKYDKDKNSIFSRDEVVDFLNDVKKIGSEDGDEENLSENEALNLYNHIMSKGNKKFKKITNFENGQNPIIEFLNKLNRNYDIKKTLEEKYDTVEQSSIDEFQKLTEEELQIAKKLMNADTNNNLKPDEICMFAKTEADLLENAISVIKILNEQGNRRFVLIDLIDLARVGTENIEKIPRLLNIDGRKFPLTLLNISIATNIAEEYLEEIIRKDPNFSIENYTGNYTKITSTASDCEELIYDNLTHKLAGKITREENDEYYIRTSVDFNTHKKRVRYESKSNPEDVKIYEYNYDANGNLISTNEYVTSTGALDLCVSSTDANGKKTPVMWTSVDSLTGERTIQKNIVSPDGTKTEYNYEQTPDGITVSEYKITDKDGNIILNQTRTFRKIDENHFTSSLNNKVYETEFSGYKITILDKSTNEVHIIDLSGKIEPESYTKIISVLKRMPADMLLKMENHRLDKFEDDWDASWDPATKTLKMVTPEDEEDSFVSLGILMHEFGHFIDTIDQDGCNGILSSNEEFVKIYKEELENFIKNASFSERKTLDYFTFYTGEEGGRLETLAECNLLLTNEYTSNRAFYLQKFFPRTIAKAAELLNNA